MKNIVKGENRTQTAFRFFTVATVLSVVLCMVFSVMFCAPGIANGDVSGPETWSEPGFANRQMTGNPNDRGGWSTNVYTEISDANPSSSGDEFVTRINNISNIVSQTVLWIVVILSALRFAARGAFEMMFRQKDGKMDSEFLDKHSFIIGFRGVGDERKNQTLESAWVIPMIKSTLFTWVIVIAIWALFQVIAGIVLFALNSVEDPGSAWQSGTHG